MNHGVVGRTVIIALVVLGCSSASEPRSAPPPFPGALPTEGSPPPEPAQLPIAIEWRTCPPTDLWAPWDCALVDVPASWDEPALGTISIFVRRRRAVVQPARAAVWMLAGGPGNSGIVYESVANEWAKLDPAIDFYAPDHRGVNLSSGLSCPDAKSPFTPSLGETVACIPQLRAKWGAKLSLFSTTQAARDVGELAGRTRGNGQSLFVYGVSYGTHWAQRYLQLFPKQASGVLMEALFVNGDLSHYHDDLEDSARRIFVECASHPFCAEKLGPAPLERLDAGLAKLEAGGCPAVSALGFDRRAIADIVSTWVYRRHSATLVPVLAYRLARCEPRDVAAFSRLADALWGAGHGGAGLGDPAPSWDRFSLVLQSHVILSELWRDRSVTATSLEDSLRTAHAQNELSQYLATLRDRWPTYDPGPLAGALADTSTPILMMQGAHDMRWTGRADLVAQFSRPYQTYVEFPTGFHGLQDAVETTGFNCALRMRVAFAIDPKAPVDTRCLANLLPIDWSVRDGAVEFGVADAWDGTPSP